jgi:transposase
LARRTFNVVEITEILVHWHAGRSISEIARSLGVDRNTVRKYTAAARDAGIQPGQDGKPISAARWAELIRGWFPQLVSTELHHPKFGEIAPFHQLIRQMLATNTVTTVHQRLRDEHGLGVSITTFRRSVWATMPDHQAGRARVTVRKDDPPPGQEAQIDDGYLGQWTDPASGKKRRVWAFVMVLSCSRHLFVRPVVAMTLAAWIEAHVAALGCFGGAPHRLVTDNLKASVIRPDLYDPKLNRTYAELASHYGVLIDPARARKPKDTPRVERPIPYVRDSFFAGRDWPSLQVMQQAAVRWSLQVAGRRSCRPLGGAKPLEVFQAREQPALLPLPAEPYQLAVWATPRSRPTATSRSTAPCTRCRGGWSATAWRCAPPPAWSRCSLLGSWSRPTCARRVAGATPTGATTRPRRSRSWPRRPLGVEAAPQTLGRMSASSWASCCRVLPATPRITYAPPRGVLRLAERYGTARLDAACQRALAAGDPSYRTVKGILAAGLEAVPLPAETTSGQAARVPALLHGPAAVTDGMPRLTTTLTTASLHPHPHPHPHPHHDDGDAAAPHGDPDPREVAG